MYSEAAKGVFFGLISALAKGLSSKGGERGTTRILLFGKGNWVRMRGVWKRPCGSTIPCLSFKPF
jgi:hypothetical protein